MGEGQIIDDYLAGNLINEEWAKEIKFPDETVMNVEVEEGWKMYFDGASNRNDNRIGILLISPNQTHKPLSFRLNFPCTNNMVEYEACIVRLKIALQRVGQNIQVFSDSAFIVH